MAAQPTGAGPPRIYTRRVSFDRLHEERRPRSSTRLAGGTLACPLCDAPVAPVVPVLKPADGLDCSFCRYEGTVRDFLSLAAPTRPTRVAVHVRLTARRSAVRA